MSTAEVPFWVARLGWLLATWALLAGRAQLAAIGLALMTIHLWLGPIVVEVKPELVKREATEVDLERWGPRPAVMTRCPECHRNVWPACRCALIRAGYPMTREESQP